MSILEICLWSIVAAVAILAMVVHRLWSNLSKDFSATVDADYTSERQDMNDEKLTIGAGWCVGDTVSAEWFHVIQGDAILHSGGDAEFADWVARRLNGPEGSGKCSCGKMAAVWQCVYGADTLRCLSCHVKHLASDDHKKEAAIDAAELSGAGER